jgi:hypothetical protein
MEMVRVGFSLRLVLAWLVALIIYQGGRLLGFEVDCHA